jgi:hypothetical protein
MPRTDGFTSAVNARPMRPGLSVLFVTGYSGADVPPNLPVMKAM